MSRMKDKKAKAKRAAKRSKSMADVPESPDGVPTPDGAVLPPTEMMVDKVDIKNDLQLEIEGAGDGLSLKISVRAPLLAEVIRKMAPSNFRRDGYHEVFKPILKGRESSPARTDDKDWVITRAAIARATRNFVGATLLNFDEPPPSIMLANPDALADGYTLVLKLDKPVAPDTVKKWGKQFMDGCGEILTVARPYKFAWVMQQVPVYK